MDEGSQKPLSGWRLKVYEVIFESETTAGRIFDIVLMLCIILSTAVVFLESVKEYHLAYGGIFSHINGAITLLFSLEYALRLLCVGSPWKYASSALGLIDLAAILPFYVGFFLPGSQYLIVVRMFRLLRIFRIFRLAEFLIEAQTLIRALEASRNKISVFLFTVCILVVVIGAVIYVVEGEENGFTSIPTSIYWAIVTLTTVGYGDLSPKTGLGRAVAAVVMILGYAIIAVPTGIVTSEMTRNLQPRISGQTCPHCSHEGHDYDAVHCKYCGAKL